MQLESCIGSSNPIFPNPLYPWLGWGQVDVNVFRYKSHSCRDDSKCFGFQSVSVSVFILSDQNRGLFGLTQHFKRKFWGVFKWKFTIYLNIIDSICVHLYAKKVKLILEKGYFSIILIKYGLIFFHFEIGSELGWNIPGLRWNVSGSGWKNRFCRFRVDF